MTNVLWVGGKRLQKGSLHKDPIFVLFMYLHTIRQIDSNARYVSRNTTSEYIDLRQNTVAQQGRDMTNTL